MCPVGLGGLLPAQDSRVALSGSSQGTICEQWAALLMPGQRFWLCGSCEASPLPDPEGTSCSPGVPGETRPCGMEGVCCL